MAPAEYGICKGLKPLRGIGREAITYTSIRRVCACWIVRWWDIFTFMSAMCLKTLRVPYVWLSFYTSTGLGKGSHAVSFKVRNKTAASSSHAAVKATEGVWCKSLRFGNKQTSRHADTCTLASHTHLNYSFSATGRPENNLQLNTVKYWLWQVFQLHRPHWQEANNYFDVQISWKALDLTVQSCVLEFLVVPLWTQVKAFRASLTLKDI